MTTSDIRAAFAPGLRPGLRWILGITILSSVAALLWPARITVGARVPEAPASPDLLPEKATAKADPPVPTAPAFPAELTPIAFDRGSFDPFMGVSPPPSDAKVATSTVAPAPPPPPAPPALTYRYMGTVIDPSGKRLVFLSRGDSTVVAAPGSALDDGYVVDKMDDAAVTLVHPASGTRVRLPIPVNDDMASSQ